MTTWRCKTCAYENALTDIKCDLCEDPCESNISSYTSIISNENHLPHSIQPYINSFPFQRSSVQQSFINQPQSQYNYTSSNLNNAHIKQVNNATWICTICNEENPSNETLCVICGVKNKVHTNSDIKKQNVIQNQTEYQYDHRPQSQVKYKPILSINDTTTQTIPTFNSSSNPTSHESSLPSNIFNNEYKNESMNNRPRGQSYHSSIPQKPSSNAHHFHTQSMADYRQIAIQNKKMLNYLEFGMKVLYPQEFQQLTNEMLANIPLQLPFLSPIYDRPYEYRLGNIRSFDYQICVVSISPLNINGNMISTDNEIKCHGLLLQEYKASKYNGMRRGETVNFWSVDKNQWHRGRIETIDSYRCTAGIAYGANGSSWETVPIFHLKPIEEIFIDEWTNAPEFVFCEYVRDIAIALAKKSFTDDTFIVDMNEFRLAMDNLGVRSEQSRNRAFEIYERLKIEIQVQIEEEKEQFMRTRALLISEGHVFASYQCIGDCKQQFIECDQQIGIQLSNCNHIICKLDFNALIDDCLQNATDMIVKCPKCKTDIKSVDIRRHSSGQRYEQMSNLELLKIQAIADANSVECQYCSSFNELTNMADNAQQYFVCKFCASTNCLQCKCVHSSRMTCAQFQVCSNHTFRKCWERTIDMDVKEEEKLDPTQFQLKDVVKDSTEWTSIVTHMKYDAKKFVRIERIEHPWLWKRYSDYATSLDGTLAEVRVWHGTRGHAPSLIYTTGFLKAKSRVGGCLWYAVQSSYSMGGFQHTMADGKFQLFLCLVAGGNTNDVKYIRGNQILNVYKDEATYPAYLITYT